jgi:hypothetical protein
MRDDTHLNWKLQDHVDDSFAAAGKVKPFRESDSEARKGKTGPTRVR